MTKQYITLVDACGPKGKALLERDLEQELIRGLIDKPTYNHLAHEQILVREYRGYHERTNPAVQFEKRPDEGLL